MVILGGLVRFVVETDEYIWRRREGKEAVEC